MSDATDSPRPADPSRVLAAIADASTDAILSTDLDGRIQTWGRSAERLYGYTAAEVTGQSMSMLLPPDRTGETAWLLGRLKAGLRIDPFDTVRVAKGGHTVDVAVTVSPVSTASGLVVGAAFLARDISGRLRDEVALRTTEARWRTIVDSAVDGIIVIDARGLIEAVNHSAERMFGYAEHELVGRNINVLMPSPYHEEHDRYIEHYVRTGEQKIIGIGREVTALRRDGTRFPIHLSVGEMRIGSERHFTGILHDLSGRVALEERLREQTALARLGEMAAVIAHEVKNPLTAVRGAIQVIGRRLPPDSRDGPVVKEVVSRLDSLNELIQDLLLFARTPTLKIAPVEVASLLRLTADFLAQDPALHNVVIDINGGAPPIMADADLLRIVLQNLLLNAAQAMQGSGTIRAVVTAGTQGGCRVAISDTGPGMSDEVREKLFRPFFTTKARGTGLGLATARRLIEAHRGTIGVECPPEGGTVVLIDLPGPPERPAAASAG